MLGKTANGIFWMYRSLERAENTSRLVETGQRIALTRLGDTSDEWRSILQTAGVISGYDQHYDSYAGDTVIDWLLRDLNNSSSVQSVIRNARQNARLVRTALTHDVWEATNGCYMEATKHLTRKVTERDLPNVLGLVRQRAALVRGATHGTMLRNDIYDFARLGTFIERADNTARILDVKYYVLLPSMMSVGSSIDNVQWDTILRSLSANGGFRMEYGSATSPRDIAQFLILDRRMPRSLAFCANKLRENLHYLENTHGSDKPSITMAEDLVSGPLSRPIDDIFDQGLHEFTQDTLAKIAKLSRQIEIDFRFYE